MSSATVPDGVEVLGGADADILAPDALALVARLQRELGPTRRALLRTAARAPGRAGRRRAPGVPRRHARRPRGRLARPAGAAGARGPPRRDHRPGRAQDDDQRAQLRRARVHGRLRGRELADLGERRRRPAERPRRRPPRDRARRRREALPAERGDRDARDPAARLAPPGAPRPRRRRARLRVALRLRRLALAQRRRAPRARLGAVPLPAEARVAPRGAALERRLRARAGLGRHPARLGPRDGADRDDPRRVRDGRDPPRARAARDGPQRGPLGLHLLGDQEVPGPRARAAPRPRAGDDDRPVHARLHGAARPHLPPAAARTRSAGWRPSSRRAATRR